MTGYVWTYMGLRVIPASYLTVAVPHPMSSERTLAKVAGGRWFSKTTNGPDPKMLRAGNVVYGHPDTIAKLMSAVQLTTGRHSW